MVKIETTFSFIGFRNIFRSKKKYLELIFVYQQNDTIRLYSSFSYNQIRIIRIIGLVKIETTFSFIGFRNIFRSKKKYLELIFVYQQNDTIRLYSSFSYNQIRIIRIIGLVKIETTFSFIGFRNIFRSKKKYLELIFVYQQNDTIRLYSSFSYNQIRIIRIIGLVKIETTFSFIGFRNIFRSKKKYLELIFVYQQNDTIRLYSSFSYNQIRIIRIIGLVKIETTFSFIGFRNIFRSKKKYLELIFVYQQNDTIRLYSSFSYNQIRIIRIIGLVKIETTFSFIGFRNIFRSKKKYLELIFVYQQNDTIRLYSSFSYNQIRIIRIIGLVKIETTFSFIGFRNIFRSKKKYLELIFVYQQNDTIRLYSSFSYNQIRIIRIIGLVKIETTFSFIGFRNIFRSKKKYLELIFVYQQNDTIRLYSSFSYNQIRIIRIIGFVKIETTFSFIGFRNIFRSKKKYLELIFVYQQNDTIRLYSSFSYNQIRIIRIIGLVKIETTFSFIGFRNIFRSKKKYLELIFVYQQNDTIRLYSSFSYNQIRIIRIIGLVKIETTFSFIGFRNIFRSKKKYLELIFVYQQNDTIRLYSSFSYNQIRIIRIIGLVKIETTFSFIGFRNIFRSKKKYLELIFVYQQNDTIRLYSSFSYNQIQIIRIIGLVKIETTFSFIGFRNIFRSKKKYLELIFVYQQNDTIRLYSSFSYNQIRIIRIIGLVKIETTFSFIGFRNIFRSKKKYLELIFVYQQNDTIRLYSSFSYNQIRIIRIIGLVKIETTFSFIGFRNIFRSKKKYLELIFVYQQNDTIRLYSSFSYNQIQIIRIIGLVKIETTFSFIGFRNIFRSKKKYLELIFVYQQNDTIRLYSSFSYNQIQIIRIIGLVKIETTFSFIGFRNIFRSKKKYLELIFVYQQNDTIRLYSSFSYNQIRIIRIIGLVKIETTFSFIGFRNIFRSKKKYLELIFVYQQNDTIRLYSSFSYNQIRIIRIIGLVKIETTFSFIGFRNIFRSKKKYLELIFVYQQNDTIRLYSSFSYNQIRIIRIIGLVKIETTFSFIGFRNIFRSKKKYLELIFVYQQNDTIRLYSSFSYNQIRIIRIIGLVKIETTFSFIGFRN